MVMRVILLLLFLACGVGADPAYDYLQTNHEDVFQLGFSGPNAGFMSLQARNMIEHYRSHGASECTVCKVTFGLAAVCSGYVTNKYSAAVEVDEGSLEIVEQQLSGMIGTPAQISNIDYDADLSHQSWGYAFFGSLSKCHEVLYGTGIQSFSDLSNGKDECRTLDEQISQVHTPPKNDAQRAALGRSLLSLALSCSGGEWRRVLRTFSKTFQKQI